MRTLLITDLHFTDKPAGLLAAQKKCILTLLEAEKYDDVIIMGDLMMHRKPTPSVMLALKEVVDFCRTKDKPVTIIRGNHDSENKSDDGVTALSVFDYHAKVVTQTWYDLKTKRAFIPHYEDEDRIKKDLAGVPKGYSVFGHFGYSGALNSAGDADFDLKPSNFRNRSFLGHVHGYVKKDNITVLGTPYTTNFGECHYDHFYAILTKTRTTLKKLDHGPRHLLYKAQDLEDNLDHINDPKWFTLLRVLVDADHHPIPYDKLNVEGIDVKYLPVFNEDEISSYEPERDLFTINEVIIEDYVEAANSTIPKEILMQGYRLLRDED
jgi:predicted phosphodiesterase